MRDDWLHCSMWGGTFLVSQFSRGRESRVTAPMKRGVIILGVMLCFNLFGASPSFQQVTNIANNEATNIVVAYTNSLASTNFVNGVVSNLKPPQPTT